MGSLNDEMLMDGTPCPSSKAKKTGKIKTGILRKPIDTIRGIKQSLLETLSNSSNRINRFSENTSLHFTSLFPFR